MSFCVTISGLDNAIGKMIYNQWKFYRDVYAQISTIDDEPTCRCGKSVVNAQISAFDDESMMPCRCGSGKSAVNTKVAEDFLNNPCMEDIEVIFYHPPYSMCRMKPEEDDTEEWYMTEYEFREWYFTHSHKYTMAFYNFFMEDEGNFRKIAPQVVEKELYKLWKDDPVLFTDMVNEFEDEDEDEYTFA